MEEAFCSWRAAPQGGYAAPQHGCGIISRRRRAVCLRRQHAKAGRRDLCAEQEGEAAGERAAGTGEAGDAACRGGVP